MVFGNYDAGRSNAVNRLFTGFTNPLSTPASNTDIRLGGTGRTDYTQVVRTTANPDERIGEGAEVAYAQVSAALGSDEQIAYDREIDNFFSPYITDETRERMASTSFNATMAMSPMDNFLG